ncbi:MAG TPA: type II toxin-antitoxin system HicB family antitoxin [Anaerolineales bacterium]|nr:type II toxin-antitoxin system HicB family antitoxin [Anaerolineales bacterium]
MVHLTLETEQEEDGRWITEIPELPGVLAYGQTEQEAMARAEALGLRVIAERLENGEMPTALQIEFTTV